MKSAYELAMDRLNASAPEVSRELTDAQREALAEIDRRFRAKIAEREVFLQKQIADARRSDLGAVDAIEKQLRNERSRLEEEKERAKDRVRSGEGTS